MPFFGSNWIDDNNMSLNDCRVARDMEFASTFSSEGMFNKEEVRLKMASLLMDVLKCRRDHALTLVDNHMKKKLKGK